MKRKCSFEPTPLPSRLAGLELKSTTVINCLFYGRSNAVNAIDRTRTNSVEDLSKQFGISDHISTSHYRENMIIIIYQLSPKIHMIFIEYGSRRADSEYMFLRLCKWIWKSI